MTLTEFLLDRIAEDQGIAESVPGGPWVPIEAENSPDGERMVHLVATEHGEQIGTVTAFDAEHITRHDPDRILAECETKRRLIELHTHDTLGTMVGCNVCDVSQTDGGLVYSGWCDTLRLLAEQYTDHPDYDEGWRP